VRPVEALEGRRVTAGRESDVAVRLGQRPGVVT